LANQFKGMTSRVLRQEFPALRSKLPTLWSRSYFAATVGNVSAATIKRYIDTQWERPWRKESGR
jgi:putative transposase